MKSDRCIRAKQANLKQMLAVMERLPILAHTPIAPFFDLIVGWLIDHSNMTSVGS
ncbi:hypothetical protein [Scytonema sp. NUACC21]